MELTENVKLTTSVIFKGRSNFSVPHMFAAALFSRQVCTIEKDNQSKPYGPFWEDIRIYSIACIFGCVASLESYVNELFVDHEKNFPEMRTDIMKKLWEYFEQKPLLEKYEFALLLKKAPSPEKGQRPYQDIDALIHLRNALTHFKPEWEDDQEIHAKVSAQLKGRFNLSPFMGDVEPIFPKKWATSGCTKWAVQSSLAFINKFEELASLEHWFDQFADRLSVE